LLCCEEEGQPQPLPASAVGALLGRLTELTAAGPAPVLAVCDYGLDDRVRRWLVAHRARFDLVAVDAQDLRAWAELSPSVVTPSWAEVAALMPDAPAEVTDRAATVEAHAVELLARTGANVAAVTLDGAGSVVVGPSGESWRSGAERAPAGWTVGAGDVYLAALTLALAATAPVTVAAAIAARAAATTVRATGTCVCSREDLLAAADRDGARVVDGPEVAALARRHRGRGERIVFTNGCFDVLHRGHVGYLAKARELGDVLVVAVNSDASVRRLKGPERPVNPVEDRVAVLAALSFVDYVVVFEADSPAALIEAVLPDVYVKGGDYPPDLVPEAPLVRRLGGDVRVLDYIPDRSTSALIERIRSRAPATGGRG
jgi:rfaE bifunctional protein nucleotidyltransferase chain/domain